MEIPPELKLDFVSNEPEYVCTDEPNMTIEDLEEDIEPMIEKKPINYEDIFSSNAVKLEVPEPVEEPIEEPIVEKPVNKKTTKDNIIEQINELKEEIPQKEGKAVKLNKNGKPRKKRVYTEEQKQQMRERMKHARATAYKNKEKKQEEKDKEVKYKQLMKKKRDMEMEEVEEKIKKKNEPKQEVKQNDKQNDNHNINKYKDVLKQAQFEAIVEYEKIRKSRKAKKKQEQQVQDYNNAVKENIKKELGWRDVAGIYADCF
tara:strand:+ start:155 stop:931 length:777 start_codon:yes stop_codon:yes gene_type:complete